MTGLLEFNLSTPWSITAEKADELKAIAERSNDVTPQMLEAYASKASDNGERLRVRDGVGILDVQGPLFKKANLFVRISGATSYEILMKDFQAALDDSTIHSILIKVDSPGGEANGCDELAQAIFAARGKKPITAFVSGMACSGGYWIASAADKIVVSDAAILGSIGVVLGIQDTSAAEEKSGRKTFQFVSSQSPGKRPDPKTEAGASRIQKMVDDLATVFVSTVARNRNVSAETVVSKFGAGGVEVGKNAVDLGMADSVGSFEATMASLVRGNKGRNQPRRYGDFTMENANTGPTAEEITASATASAQSRIKAITVSEHGKLMPTLAAFLAFDTAVTADVAGKILAAAKEDMPAPASLEQTSEEKPAPQPQQSFVDRKTEAGALGLGQPAATAPDKGADIAASWSKATAEANRSIGA